MDKKLDAVLSPNFVEEMMKLAFSNREYARMVTENLDLSNFPRELGGCKAMLKVLSDNMKRSGGMATFGMVEMAYRGKEDVLRKIEEVKKLPVPEFNPMVEQLESFIKKQTFVAVQHRISDMYNEGKYEEAMQLLEREMVSLNAFSLTDSKRKFQRVFKDFERNVNSISLKATDETRQAKVPTGITSIDDLTDGGISRQDTVLWIMRSGVGKSTALKYMAWYNTAIAHNHVLHVQLEGGADEAVVKFDQMVAHTTYAKIMRGDLTDETRLRIKTLINRAGLVNSDIDVYATDEMIDMTIAKLVEVVDDYYKTYGYLPDLLTIDSLDLMITGENKKIDFDPSFIKYKLQRCAQRLKDIAKKYDMAVVTATQTSDVPFEIWNDPNKVITRNNTEGDRTLVKPFSFVFTGNMTLEESSKNLARVFCDKLRNYKNNGIVILIPTNYENGFFYDMSRSTQIEKILDMSALEKLSRPTRKKGEEGSNSDRVELEPGVYGTKPVEGKKIPKKRLKDDDYVSPSQMKDSFVDWHKNKEAR